MTILGIIDPPDCDERGVPLDWERCRRCDGSGKVAEPQVGFGRCPACDGHGSLKAAALEVKRQHSDRCLLKPVGECICGPARCEDCGHPMSEGTWEGRIEPDDSTRPESERDLTRRGAYFAALHELRRGREPFQGVWLTRPSLLPPPVHYSPCDEGCRHGGEGVRWDRHIPGTINQGWITGDITVPVGEHLSGATPLDGTYAVEASWRDVDVWTLGWPHDLRPEKLAVLCLRCWAERA